MLKGFCFSLLDVLGLACWFILVCKVKYRVRGLT